MTSNICYAVVYFIESLISLYYFDFNLETIFRPNPM